MTEIGTVRTKGLRLREKAQLHSRVKDELERGDMLEVYKHDAPYGEEWLYVKVTKTRTGIGEGQHGWVYGADVTLSSTPPPPPAPAIVQDSSPAWLWLVVAFVAVAAFALTAWFFQ